MATLTARHFDYLVDYGQDLEELLGLSDLSKNVDHWRHFGMEFPDMVLVGCRKTVETSLKTLMAPLPDDRMEFREIIDYTHDEHILDDAMTLKCHEIRKKGNKGAHASAQAIDAQMVLDLLDDFLRWNAVELGFKPMYEGGDSAPKDPIFIVKSEDEIAEMSRKAKLAAALDDNKEIEKKTQQVKSKMADFDESRRADLEKIADLISQAEEIASSATARQDDSVLESCERLFDICDEGLNVIKAEKAEVDKSVDAVNAEIEEILSEHDFVKRLLHGDNRATEKQLNVMAFPRGSNSVTNILQIAGGAGTGKTLCLLAKIIAAVDDHGQTSMFGEPQKRALFICFNKGLANYVRSILSGYDGVLPAIEVAHYDEFINQLVREKPKVGYEHLAQYADDVRYKGPRIIYGSDKTYAQLLRKAQSVVARMHPECAGDYYLDPSKEDEFDWLCDELVWIEARFANDRDAEAHYPRAERVGRGTKHLPSEAVRRIILEIRRELNRLLDESGRYTIEQATKRLLASNSLPAYDAIAIDEVQDFSLLSIRLLLRFRRSDRSMVFLSGDENQKIYQRDFTWRELDAGLRGYTITLQKNMRNSAAIRRFSDRLLGIKCPHESACRFVHIQNADNARVVELLRKLSDTSKGETSALIGDKQYWVARLKLDRVPVVEAPQGSIRGPGLYLLSGLGCKGLEFDNIVVDYTKDFSEDEEAERRLRYVHFTRARKRLYIRYLGNPPKLLSRYYSDFLQ